MTHVLVRARFLALALVLTACNATPDAIGLQGGGVRGELHAGGPMLDLGRGRTLTIAFDALGRAGSRLPLRADASPTRIGDEARYERAAGVTEHARTRRAHRTRARRS